MSSQLPPKKLSKEEIRFQVNNNPDFIALSSFEYSLDKLLNKYPDGVPMKVIARALAMTEEQVEALYKRAIDKLRVGMRIQQNEISELPDDPLPPTVF